MYVLLFVLKLIWAYSEMRVSLLFSPPSFPSAPDSTVWTKHQQHWTHDWHRVLSARVVSHLLQSFPSSSLVEISSHRNGFLRLPQLSVPPRSFRWRWNTGQRAAWRGEGCCGATQAVALPQLWCVMKWELSADCSKGGGTEDYYSGLRCTCFPITRQTRAKNNGVTNVFPPTCWM